MRAISCATLDNKIGKDGNLLYRFDEDIGYFWRMTTTPVGYTNDMPIVVMGRKTYESLPGKRPLKARKNYIVSSTITAPPDGFEIVNNVSAFLRSHAPADNDIWVIGGGMLYRMLAPFCTEFHVTRLNVVRPDADSMIPDLTDPNLNFQLASKTPWTKSKVEGIPEYSIEVYTSKGRVNSHG